MDTSKVAKILYDRYVQDRKGLLSEGKPFPHWVNLDPAEQARWEKVAEVAYWQVREALAGAPVR